MTADERVVKSILRTELLSKISLLFYETTGKIHTEFIELLPNIFLKSVVISP